MILKNVRSYKHIDLHQSYIYFFRFYGEGITCICQVYQLRIEVC
jgi:hypothetical protein